MSGPVPTFKTRPRKPQRMHALPHGHVTTQQLKREVLAGVEYFWRRRPSAVRPDTTGFLDLRNHRAA